MTQTIRPRQTINLRRRGATASGKINYLNFARLTNKNKRGSYSIVRHTTQSCYIYCKINYYIIFIFGLYKKYR